MITVIGQPAAVVTPAEARVQLRLDTTIDDALLAALIAAATAAISGPQGWLGRAIGVQTLELRLDGFPCAPAIPLYCPPLRSVVSVKYDDVAGVEQTVPSTSYGLLPSRGVYAKAGYAWPASSGRPESVRVSYEAGYAAGEVPAPIQQAILLGVRELLTVAAQDPALRSETAEGVGSQTWTISADTTALLQNATERLLAPYRVFSL